MRPRAGRVFSRARNCGLRGDMRERDDAIACESGVFVYGGLVSRVRALVLYLRNRSTAGLERPRETSTAKHPPASALPGLPSPRYTPKRRIRVPSPVFMAARGQSGSAWLAARGCC